MSPLVEVQVQRECTDCGGGGIVGVVDSTMSRDAFGDDRAVGHEVECTTCGGQGWLPDVDLEEVPE